mmetsp:Transcript_4790/g.10895  ORF Transcript_4790/g.10895 Transcript_4790/m.10895 type:complete len:88 (-) Transcript_4790:109-372(-)
MRLMASKRLVELAAGDDDFWTAVVGSVNAVVVVAATAVRAAADMNFIFFYCYCSILYLYSRTRYEYLAASFITSVFVYYFSELDKYE